jgi:hypothetical protein
MCEKELAEGDGVTLVIQGGARVAQHDFLSPEALSEMGSLSVIVCKDCADKVTHPAVPSMSIAAKEQTRVRIAYKVTAKGVMQPDVTSEAETVETAMANLEEALAKVEELAVMKGDQYEAHVGEVKFDPKKDWDEVGNGNFMPQPQVYSEIAIKRGVECSPEEHCERIFEDVDINPLLMKDITEPPTIRKMELGYMAVKRGSVLIEDGTYLPSDPCRASYNVWERCIAAWTKEELYTEGYSKKGKYPPKYETTWKRRKHYREELIFAQRQADTKARHVVIRHLAGLKTGYKEADIKSGSFVFVRIQRSRESLKLEQAARLDAIRNGAGMLPDNRAGQKLFGPPAESTLTIHETVEPEPEPAAAEKDIPFGDVPWEDGEPPALTILDVLQAYHDGGLIADDGLKANTKRGIDYMRQAKDFGPEDSNWAGAVTLLHRIESTLDNDKLIAHDKWE